MKKPTRAQKAEWEQALTGPLIPNAVSREMRQYDQRLEIHRLATGKVDRSFDARVEAARLDDAPLSPDDLNVPPEDIPF